MRAPDYWKSHYVTSTDPAEIDLALRHASLHDGHGVELIHFLHALDAPNVLISQGSGGHTYVFAELAYQVHLRGFNVFVMPKHGGRTVNQLMSRHLEVLQYIRAEFNDRIGLYGEGLGGYVAFSARGTFDVPSSPGHVYCAGAPANTIRPCSRRLC